MAGESFKRSAGAPKGAYQDLSALFAEFRRLQDAYDDAQPQKWLLPDGPERDRVIASLKSARRAQAALFEAARPDADTLLAQAEAQIDALDEWERGNLRLFRRQHTHFLGFMDVKSMEDYEDVTAAAESAFLETLKIADKQEAFRRQIPIMESVFAARRRVMAAPAQRMGVPVSQACLDIYSPGATNEAVERTYKSLSVGWSGYVERLREREAQAMPPLPFTQDIAPEDQLRLFARVMDAMLSAAGWDQETRAREGIAIELTTAQTGFSWGSGKNVRLAIEAYPRDVLRGLANAMHECGHMLYTLEMNRMPESVRGQPVAQPNGTAKNESVALYFERVGLQEKFFALVTPIIRQELGVSGPEWEAKNLHRLANRMDVSDTGWGISEAMLTPNMAWRAPAERMILDGEMTVSELPDFWARTMEEYTGIPHDSKEFIVGEDHWPAGLMGYFYAYQDGVMDAAALHDEAAAQNRAQDLQARSLAEYLQPYYAQVRDRIFRHASLETPHDMMAHALAKPTDAGSYLEKLLADINPASATPVAPAPRPG